MEKIKRFKDFAQTNEVFGHLAKKAGEGFAKVSQYVYGRPASSKTKEPGKGDGDLGIQILSNINILCKESLSNWLGKQTEDDKKDWIKKYASPYIKERCKKEKDPNNKWPDIYDNGIIKIQEVIDWIYDNKKEDTIDWTLVYDPKNPKPLDNQGNNFYFFVTNINGEEYRVEIIKHLDFKRNSLKSKEFTVTLMEKKSKPNLNYSKIKVRQRNAPAKDYEPSGFVGDSETKSELNLEPKLAESIFKAAEKIFNITNKTAKGGARK